MSDLITISSSVVPESARVVGFRGTEAISRPYEMEIFLQLRQEIGEEFRETAPRGDVTARLNRWKSPTSPFGSKSMTRMRSPPYRKRYESRRAGTARSLIWR